MSPGNTNLRFIGEGEEAPDPLDPNSTALEDPKTGLRRMVIKRLGRTREGQRQKWLNGKEDNPWGVQPRKLREWWLKSTKGDPVRPQGRPPALNPESWLGIRKEIIDAQTSGLVLGKGAKNNVQLLHLIHEPLHASTDQKVQYNVDQLTILSFHLDAAGFNDRVFQNQKPNRQLKIELTIASAS